MAAATASAAARSRSATTTAAPSAASASAVAAPIAPAPPVTTQTLPSTRPGRSPIVLLRGSRRHVTDRRPTDIMPAMRAAILRSHGGPEAIEAGDWPDPEPGPGEVLIEVVCASLNRRDVWIRRNPARVERPVV